MTREGRDSRRSERRPAPVIPLGILSVLLAVLVAAGFARHVLWVIAAAVAVLWAAVLTRVIRNASRRGDGAK